MVAYLRVINWYTIFKKKLALTNGKNTPWGMVFTG